MTRLHLVACGPGTGLQDGGRIGQGRVGLSRSGAMDRLALAEANTLVGNPFDAGAIELALVGATIEVEEGRARMALAGAAMAATIDGAPCPPSRGFDLAPGQRLVIGAASRGVFGYLAVAGGFDLPASLGSLSLQARAGIGGVGGRNLAGGDRLPLRAAGPPPGPPTSLPPTALEPDARVRVVLGPQDDYFPAEAIASFLDQAYRVSGEADRMGYRLAGEPIAHRLGYNIVSDGIVAGSIQVPGSGVPIVLMADHQTTGGYPKIATVVTADLRILAQRRPGDTVWFEAVPIAEAEALARERAALVASLPARLATLSGGLPGVEDLLGLNLAGVATDALAPIEP